MGNASLYLIISLLALALISVAIALYKERKRRILIERKFFEFSSDLESNFQGRAKFSELGLMLAGIAHEINNSLSIILGRSEQLLNRYRRPDSQKIMAEGLNQIIYTSQRMEKIVKGIRQLIYQDERMDEAIPLSEIIENTLLFCGQRLKNHNIELRVINTESCFVNGSKTQLEQAFLNLINNSLDAIDTLDEKWIEINAVETKDSVDIYVRDSGHGIPAAIKEHMLEPFFTSKKGKGTGLGLPLVKNIARKHGGDLTYIEQAPHTTFLLELPKELPLIMPQ